MRRKIRVLVVGEEDIARDGVCALLALEKDFEATAISSSELRLHKSSGQAEPSVVIVDFAVGGRGAPERIAAIRNHWVRARVLVLTHRKEEQAIEGAMRAGVDGYLLMSDSRPELAIAIRTVIEGKRYISPSLFQGRAGANLPKRAVESWHDTDALSDREREVIRRIAMGYRTREIAVQLSLSHKTVEKHRSNLMRKLGLRTATAVAAYAITNGYLDT